MERRITRYQRLANFDDGMYIKEVDLRHIKKTRLTYGRYLIRVFIDDVYKGLIREGVLWGPGKLIQHSDMTFNFYMEEY